MSDLVATNCGCNGDSGCSSIIWIIILLCLCNGNGSSPFSGGGCGGDYNGCLWIILLLMCCGNGCGGGLC